MLGARHELVVGVEDRLFAILTGADDALHHETDSQPDARHGGASEPLRDHVTAAVDDGGFDRATPLTGVHSDVLDDTRDLVPLSHPSLGYGDGPWDASAPRSEIVCPDVLGGPREALEEPAGSCHDGQVWQYRRANLWVFEDSVEGAQ